MNSTQNRLKGEKWATVILSFMALTGFGFKKDKPDMLQSRSSFFLRFQLHATTSPRVPDLAWNGNTGNILVSFEPVPLDQPNIFSFNFNSLIKNEIFLLGKLKTSPIRKVLSGSKQNYQVFGSSAGEIVIFKNAMDFGEFSLDSEITALAFNESETLLAVGTGRGEIVVYDMENNFKVVYKERLFSGKAIKALFRNDSALFAAGEGAGIFEVNVSENRTVRTFTAMSFLARSLKAIGVNYCSRPRTNELTFVKSMDMLVTSHGWEYCQDRVVRVWNASSGEVIREFRSFQRPVFHMAWVPAIDAAVLVDNLDNLWKLSLKEMRLAGPVKLKKTFERVVGNAPSSKRKRLGHVNAMATMGDTPYLLMAMGSYFQLGGGVYVIKFTDDSFYNVIHLTMDSLLMNRRLKIYEAVMIPYLNAELFKEFIGAVP